MPAPTSESALKEGGDRSDKDGSTYSPWTLKLTKRNLYLEGEGPIEGPASLAVTGWLGKSGSVALGPEEDSWDPKCARELSSSVQNEPKLLEQAWSCQIGVGSSRFLMGDSPQLSQQSQAPAAQCRLTCPPRPLPTCLRGTWAANIYPGPALGDEGDSTGLPSSLPHSSTPPQTHHSPKQACHKTPGSCEETRQARRDQTPRVTREGSDSQADGFII